jgi:REP element-mobilizing transposase RayT
MTWVPYGTWLPGDERGFVSTVRDGDGPRIRHNIPGTPVDTALRGLRQAARAQMRGEPIYLKLEQAEALLAQFQETATHRSWLLLAVAVMANHIHVVVGVPGDPPPEDILGDFKSYGSRKLNRRWGKPKSETWWAESGSKRKLPNEDAVVAAIVYVRDQEHPLVVWLSPEALAMLGEGPASGGRQPPESAAPDVARSLQGAHAPRSPEDERLRGLTPPARQTQGANAPRSPE